MNARLLQRWLDGIDWQAKLNKVTLGPDDYYYAFKTTSISDTSCTGYAIELQRLFPRRVQCFGFFNTQNPRSRIARDFGGHDFAVLDRRFILDPWLTRVEVEERAVFDLEDPEDAGIIADLYGDRGCWSPLLHCPPSPVLRAQTANMRKVRGPRRQEARRLIPGQSGRLDWRAV